MVDKFSPSSWFRNNGVFSESEYDGDILSFILSMANGGLHMRGLQYKLWRHCHCHHLLRDDDELLGRSERLRAVSHVTKRYFEEEKQKILRLKSRLTD